MGKIDGISRQYLKRNDVFADIVNLMEFAGRNVITPDMLREKDTAVQQVIVKGKTKGMSVVQRYRDTLKSVHWKSDDAELGSAKELQSNQESVYAIIGVEEQTKIHYGAPVQAMIYDALNVGFQKDAERTDRKISGLSDTDIRTVGAYGGTACGYAFRFGIGFRIYQICEG